MCHNVKEERKLTKRLHFVFVHWKALILGNDNCFQKLFLFYFCQVLTFKQVFEILRTSKNVLAFPETVLTLLSKMSIVVISNVASTRVHTHTDTQTHESHTRGMQWHKVQRDYGWSYFEFQCSLCNHKRKAGGHRVLSK